MPNLVVRPASLVCITALAAILASACSTKDEDLMTEAQFCQEYAKRECAAIAPFCGYLPAACEPTRTTACQNRIIVWRNANGGATARPFRPGNTEACLNKVSETYATFPVVAQTLKTLNDTCARVFQGNAVALQACVVDLDCDGTLICDKAKGGGLCAEKKPVAAGALCANPGETCVATESCKAGAVGGILQCSARPGAGAACSAADPCLDTLRCAGTCVARVATGSACTQDDDCTTGYCDPYSLKCGGGLSFATNSDSCRAYTGTLTPVADAAVAD